MFYKLAENILLVVNIANAVNTVKIVLLLKSIVRCFMAIPWLTVLSNIPWREVIVNAPRVADEAKNLWTNLNDPDAKKRPTTRKPADKAGNGNDETATALQAKVEALEQSVADLHQQMIDSSMLIKALADQNETLVKHIEINRSRFKLILIVLLVFIAFTLFAFYKFQLA